MVQYTVFGIIPLPSYTCIWNCVRYQYCTSGTILAANTIPNTGKFAKMVHPGFFFVKMVVEVLITLT